MDGSAFGPETIIPVQRFHHDPAEPLLVEIISSDDVGSGATARIHVGRAGPPGCKYEVALKVFPNLLDKSKQQLVKQLILREVDAISRLSKQNMPRILPFIGTAEIQFQLIIVSEFMRNGNLLQYFRAPSPSADRQELVIQVAEGVSWLHECANLVHGDLKCENVLVNDQGDAVIADFGLSTLVEHGASDITTGTAIRDMSTLRFAAPELLCPPAREETGVRPRSKTRESDVYAFGMLILQAFSGTHPWPALSKFAVVTQVANRITHPRPSDEATMNGLTNSWWAVCLECWERDPHDRPTMKSVWETLEKTQRKPRILLSIGGLSTIALTPCAKRVATGTNDGSVAIWDADTGAAIGGPLHGDSNLVRVSHIAVSPDGHQICLCGQDPAIRRWDLKSGAPIGEPMTGHNHWVLCVAYSPYGTRIVSGSTDRTVRIWDARTGVALGGPLAGHTHSIWSVAFSPDGGYIASGSLDGTVRLWNSATGKSFGVLDHPGSQVFSICFSPDRIHLASGYDDGTIRIWNVSTLQLAHNINAHSALVTSLAASPSGRYIASGSSDKSIRIWDAQTGVAVGARLNGHTGWVQSVAFFPDGRRLLSGSGGGRVWISDLFE